MKVYKIRDKMTGKFLADKDMDILEFEFAEEAISYINRCKYNMEIFNIEEFEVEE